MDLDLFSGINTQKKNLARPISSHLDRTNLVYNYIYLFHSPWCAAPTSDLRSQYWEVYTTWMGYYTVPVVSTQDAVQHLQVDLLTIHALSVVSTQGAVTESSWVSSYLVHYSLDGNEWIVLTDEGGEIKVCFSTVYNLQKLR